MSHYILKSLLLPLFFVFFFMEAKASNIMQFMSSGTSSGGSGAFNGHTLITTSGNWVVPAGVTSVDVIIVGGGAGGSAAFEVGDGSCWGGIGGSSGNFKTYTGISVTPNQIISVKVGQGGAGGTTYGTIPKGEDSCFGTFCSTGSSDFSGGGYAGKVFPTYCTWGTGSAAACSNCGVNLVSKTGITLKIPVSSVGVAGGCNHSSTNYSCGSPNVANGGSGGEFRFSGFSDLSSASFGKGGNGGDCKMIATGSICTVGNGSPGGAGVVYVRW